MGLPAAQREPVRSRQRAWDASQYLLALAAALDGPEPGHAQQTAIPGGKASSTQGTEGRYLAGGLSLRERSARRLAMWGGYRQRRVSQSISNAELKGEHGAQRCIPGRSFALRMIEHAIEEAKHTCHGRPTS